MDTLTSVFSLSQNKMANSYDDISIRIQNEAGIYGLFMFIAVYQRAFTYILWTSLTSHILTSH